MIAVVTGTPIQVEGEPAEIAQLVELLSTGAVMVEHVHRWRIGEDVDGVSEATCWCGQTRTFAPYDEANRTNTNTQIARQAPVDAGPPRVTAKPEALAARKAKRAGTCSVCGQSGHTRRTCGRQAAA